MKHYYFNTRLWWWINFILKVILFSEKGFCPDMSSCRSPSTPKSVRSKTTHHQNHVSSGTSSSSSTSSSGHRNVTHSSSFPGLTRHSEDVSGEPLFVTRFPTNAGGGGPKERSPFQGADIIKTDSRHLFHQHVPHLRGQPVALDPGFIYWQQMHFLHPSLQHMSPGIDSNPFEGHFSHQSQTSSSSSLLRCQEVVVPGSSFNSKMTSTTESSASYVLPSQAHHLLQPMTLLNLNPYQFPSQQLLYHPPLVGHSSLDSDFYYHSRVHCASSQQVNSSSFKTNDIERCCEVQNIDRRQESFISGNHDPHKLPPNSLHGRARRCFSDSASLSLSVAETDRMSVSSFSPTCSSSASNSCSTPSPSPPAKFWFPGQQANSSIIKTVSSSQENQDENCQKTTGRKVVSKQTRIIMTDDRTSFSSSSLSSLPSSSPDDDCLVSSLESCSSSLSDEKKEKKAPVTSSSGGQQGNQMNSFVTPRVVKTRRRRKKSCSTDHKTSASSSSSKVVLDSDLLDPFCTLLLLHSLSHHLLRSFLDDIGKQIILLHKEVSLHF